VKPGWLAVLAAMVAGLPGRSGREEAWLRGDAEALPFVHTNGAAGEKYLVETMGAGAVVFDMDSDGAPDVYLINGAPLPGSETGGAVPGNRLFRNDGRGGFADVTSEAGVGDTGYGMGGCAGDYDNDGDTDLFLTNFGPDVLYRNNGDGTFAREPPPAPGEREWSASCSFGDLDADGFLDLFVVRYLDFALDNHKYCGLLRPGYRVYCEPDVYRGVADSLYWNDLGRGGGWTPFPLDPRGASGNGLGVVVADLDENGLLDVFVANDRTPNALWLSRGERRLEEGALFAGVALSAEGGARAGMGVDVADYDGDGRLDLVVTNFSRESNALFRSLGKGLFTDAAAASGIALPSFLPLGFGVNFWDFDNDGDEDLFVANGHVTDNIELYQPDLRHAQPDQLFLNRGEGRFEPVPEARIGELAEPRVSRGSALADWDGDGRSDLLVTHAGGPAMIFWNRYPEPGRAVVIQLVGRRAARDPQGALVSVELGGVRRRRLLRGASSYLSQSEARVRLGLGAATHLDAVEVTWPGGKRERFSAGPGAAELLLVEGWGESR
jgi:hypothetical protein